MLDDVERMHSSRSTLTLPQAIEEYLTWLELDRHASGRTVSEYRRDLDRFGEFVNDHPAAQDITAIDRDLLRMYQRLLARSTVGPAATKHPLAPTTRARRLVALRSFLKFAAREEWLAGDLGSTIDVPRLPERLPKPLEEADRKHLLDGLPHSTFPEKRDRAFIHFLLSTGARISEALRLDRSDWTTDRITVRGKGDRERVVLVTGKARDAMDAYLSDRTDPSPALFVSFYPSSKDKNTNRLTPRGARHICKKLAQQLGIPPFHPHQLRHTLGTLLQETIGDARLTAETLGHRGLGSVSGYTKLTDSRRRKAYEEMEKAGL